MWTSRTAAEFGVSSASRSGVPTSSTCLCAALRARMAWRSRGHPPCLGPGREQARMVDADAGEGQTRAVAIMDPSVRFQHNRRRGGAGVVQHARRCPVSGRRPGRGRRPAASHQTSPLTTRKGASPSRGSAWTMPPAVSSASVRANNGCARHGPIRRPGPVRFRGPASVDDDVPDAGGGTPQVPDDRGCRPAQAWATGR